MAYGADLGSSQILNMKLEDIKLELYVVVNQEGKFFHAIGYGGVGKSWVDTLDKAKIYTKIGQARSRVTWWFTNHPKFGRPQIIKLTATGTEILDEEERLKKAVEKKETTKAKTKAMWAEHNLKCAEERLKEAQRELDRLKKS